MEIVTSSERHLQSQSIQAPHWERIILRNFATYTYSHTITFPLNEANWKSAKQITLCDGTIRYGSTLIMCTHNYMCVYITKSLHSRPLAKNQPADYAHSIYSILVTMSSMERLDSSMSDLI